MRTTFDIADDVLQAAKGVKHHGHRVTFDRSIPWEAVRGAERKHVLSL
jgi:hypothetical protein